ncbi:DUF4157 domain-containing protein [Streptomyces sp. NPDC000151]|uniref:eCIS core domain-containing protein n=1 Tax=Streptomyces sp. NPDC000151 TaxID=3154244 RepID=UPI00332D1B33
MRDTEQQRAPGTGRREPASARARTEAGPGLARSVAALTGRGGRPTAGDITALQRAAGNTAVTAALAGTADPAPVQRSAVHDVLRSQGRPLDDEVRGDMEARLGADFSTVRLHSDGVAQRSAAEVGARAYTSGEHIVLGAGGTDRHTLAHELTHVIQQRQGPVAGTDRGDGLRVSDPSDAYERAAEANATRALAGPAPVQRAEGAAATRGGGTAEPVVQRAIAGAQRTRITDALKAGSQVVVAAGDGSRGRLTFHGDHYRVQKSKRDTVTVDEATLWRDYTLLGTVRAGERLPLDLDPGDLPGNTKTQERNGAQVMDFDTSPVAFAHYSYDLMPGPGKGGNQRTNDHLTIENSLPAMLTSLKHSPGKVEADLHERPHKMKPHFNRQLNEAGHADIDNINFRPTENRQGPRPIGAALDPTGALRADKNRKDTAADPIPVEERIHLESFLGYIDTAMRRLELGQGMRTAIADSIRTMQGRMGFDADKLYLNFKQREDFTRFVVLVTSLTGSRGIPDVLAQMAGNEAKADLSDADFRLIRDHLDSPLREQIADKVEGGGTWSVVGNGPDLKAVRSAIAKHYWDTIVDWARNP